MIRLFGSRVYISVFTVVLLAVAAISVDAVFLMIVLCGALLHEYAHITVMKMLGAEIIKISLYPFGADIKADMSSLSYRAEVAVYLAGPVISLLACLISLFMYRYAGMYLAAFSASNFLFFFVNILPVKGLDGGRALEAVLCEKYGISYADRIYGVISTVFFGVLCFLALTMFFLSGYNLSLIFITAYLFVSEYVRQRLCL